MMTLPIGRPAHTPMLLQLRDAAAVDVLRTIHEMAEDDDAPDFVRRMASYIHAYLFEPALDFQGVIASAQRPEVDTATIAEGFAEATGSPPMALVDTARCDVARQLVAGNDLSIMQIVRLVGFSSYSEFSRVVRLGSQSPELRAVIARHRAAGATADVSEIEPVLACLVESLSGPAFHRLLAGMLESVPVIGESE